MGKFEGVFFASDYDDTLLNSEEKVSEENYKAVEYFIKNSGHFTVATGRAFPAFVNHWKTVPINAPVVLSNGATIYDFQKEKTLYTSYLPMRVRNDCREIVRLIPEIGFEAYHGEEIYVYNPNEVTYSHVERVGVSFRESAIEDMPLPWVKVLFEHDTPILERVAELIKAKWNEHYEIVFSNPYLLEMTDKGCNKGSSVLKVADMLGIEKANIYTAGDNRNDIPMFECSNIGFAPENCAPELKNCGARIVSSCDKHCIKSIIEILDTIY